MSEIYQKTSPNSYISEYSGVKTDEVFGNTSNHTPQVVTNYTDSLTGSYLAGYKSIIRAGGNATTPLDGVKYQIDGSTYFSYTREGFYPIYDGRKYTYNAYGYPPYGWHSPAFSVSASLMNDIRNRAKRKFLDNAKSARSSFEAGQDIGEIKQTIASFVHPMESLKKLTLGYFSRLKKAKKQYRKAPSLHKALADSYLEYRFGWRPLALDLADAYSGLTNRLRMKEVAPCYGSASGSERISSSFATPTWGFDSRMYLSTNAYVEYSYRIKGAIRLNLDKSGHIPVMQALQLSTLNDFAVTAWDLLPYSFVVDYFTNVGDIINAISFPSSDLTYICATERKTIVDSYDLILQRVADPPDGSFIWTGQGVQSSNTRFKVTSFNRRSLDDLDLVPSARFSVPTSSRPWENIGALIAANTKSLVPFFNIKELRQTYTE